MTLLGSIPSWMLTGQNPDSNDPSLNSLGTSTSDPTGNLPFSSIDPATLQALGWTGGNPIVSTPGVGGNQDTGPTPATNTLSPQFLSFLQAKGITPSLTSGLANGQTSGNGQNLAFYNGSSTSPTTGQVGVTQNANFGNDNAFMLAAALGLGGAAGIASGAIGGGAAVGAADSAPVVGGSLGGANGALLSPEYQATLNGIASGPSLTDAATQAAAGASDAGGGSIAGGATAGGALAPAAAGAAGGGLLSTIGSGITSALTSKGIGALVGAGAGLLGNATGLNSATTTTAKTIDPRIAQYVYGADGNSGLLGDVNGVLNSQLATGGLNATQQAGLASQLAVLNDPNYSTGFNQEKSLGSSLLSNPVAGNPFTGGGASVSTAPSMGANVPSGAPTPLAGTLAPGQTPAQLQAQRMQIPTTPPMGRLTMRNGGAVRMGLL